ncbi:MHYT domain-containing protein [Methylobacterium sp. J-092]|uniref:MHYT domain-containing protein n=1 Tax=Methylobacterium sp. J-092 TaxID=2836667 RepID=UPI00391B3D8F
MPSLLVSLIDNQALSFIVAGATICAFSAWLVVSLIHYAEISSTTTRRWWMAGTAVVAGTGVWTTHFVAMLGYRTDLVLSYPLLQRWSPPLLQSLQLAYLSLYRLYARADGCALLLELRQGSVSA